MAFLPLSFFSLAFQGASYSLLLYATIINYRLHIVKVIGRRLQLISPIITCLIPIISLVFFIFRYIPLFLPLRPYRLTPTMGYIDNKSLRPFTGGLTPCSLNIISFLALFLPISYNLTTLRLYRVWETKSRYLLIYSGQPNSISLSTSLLLCSIT